MEQEQIVLALSKRAGMTQRKAFKAFKAFIDIAQETLARGERLNMRGLGTFTVYMAPERKAWNLIKNEPVVVPSRRKVKFKVAIDLKRMM